MKAVRYLGNSKCKIIDVPIPRIKPNEVLISMRTSGICGSDLWGFRIKNGDIDALTKSKVKINKIPIPGHEPAGIVEQVGSCVKNVGIGERVAVYHKRGCGYCEYCLSGKVYFCKNVRAISEHIDGSCADYLVTDGINCLRLPDDFTFDDGAILMCSGGTAYSGIKKIKPSGADVVAVYGLGPVGLCSLIFAKAFGSKVIAIDINENRLKLAKSFGADYTINSRNDVMKNKVYEVSAGIPISAMDTVKKIFEITGEKGADAAILGTGNIQARINAINCLKKGGRMVLLGMSESKDLKGDMQQALEIAILKELSIFGSNVFPISMYWEILDFLRFKSIAIGKIITHKFRIDEAQTAFEMAETESYGKVAFIWD